MWCSFTKKNVEPQTTCVVRTRQTRWQRTRRRIESLQIVADKKEWSYASEVWFMSLPSLPRSVPTSFTHPTTECFLRLSTVGFKRGAAAASERKREWERQRGRERTRERGAGEAHALSLSPLLNPKPELNHYSQWAERKGGKILSVNIVTHTCSRLGVGWGCSAQVALKKERLARKPIYYPSTSCF